MCDVYVLEVVSSHVLDEVLYADRALATGVVSVVTVLAECARHSIAIYYISQVVATDTDVYVTGWTSGGDTIFGTDPQNVHVPQNTKISIDGFDDLSGISAQVCVDLHHQRCARVMECVLCSATHPV